MPLFDIGHRAATVFNGLEEVALMGPVGNRHVLLEVFLVLVLGILVPLAVGLAAMGRLFLSFREKLVLVDARLQGSLVAVQEEGPRVVGVGRVAIGTMRPHNVQLVEIERGDLSVGNIAGGVGMDISPPDTVHTFRPTQVEHPPDRVEHVDAHIPYDAVAIFPEHPPPARMNHRIEGAHRGGAGPHLVVEVLRRVGVLPLLVAPHAIVTADFGVADRSQQPFLDHTVAGLDQMGRAAALRTDLHHAVVLPRGGHHRLAFLNVDADRLLHVDVGPRLASFDHRHGVPMVGRADHHHIQVFFGQHLPKIAVGARFFARFLA